ncbi:hypothetical protein SAMN05216296_2458 [Pseudomonas pohangensis]|uniref:Uncharacterized protein n=1 Tax=Pseudomonas pohangensis TaxID=364197 RepID=A0A1H2GPV0_9PSED|nr:hypothetical protein [Pseudomonas pohangensis]SDU21700.1 hypothetical protein SAMN05216296_2458 [Pseudomonas pohangensis]
MRAYTASDILSFFEQHRPLATHYIVAHTRFRPSNCSAAQIARFAQQTSADLHHALNHFTDLVNPGHERRARKKQHQFRPLTLSTIEFLNPNVLQSGTVHVNVCLGNISKEFATADIERFFRHCWVNEVKQADKINVQELSIGHTVFDYVLKEAKSSSAKAMDCLGTWDVDNTFVPNDPAF